MSTRTSEGVAATRKSIREGTCGACILRRGRMCTAASITTRSLFVQRLRWQHCRQAKRRERARLSRIKQCALASSSCSRWSCLLIRLRGWLRAHWRHRGCDRGWRGYCALRWLKSRLDLRRRREERRRVCGAQYRRKGGSACSGDLRCGCARHRLATNSVVIRSEDASRVELAQS